MHYTHTAIRRITHIHNPGVLHTYQDLDSQEWRWAHETVRTQCTHTAFRRITHIHNPEGVHTYQDLDSQERRWAHETVPTQCTHTATERITHIHNPEGVHTYEDLDIKSDAEHTRLSLPITLTQQSDALPTYTHIHNPEVLPTYQDLRSQERRWVHETLHTHYTHKATECITHIHNPEGLHTYQDLYSRERRWVHETVHTYCTHKAIGRMTHTHNPEGLYTYQKICIVESDAEYTKLFTPIAHMKRSDAWPTYTTQKDYTLIIVNEMIGLFLQKNTVKGTIKSDDEQHRLSGSNSDTLHTHKPHTHTNITLTQTSHTHKPHTHTNITLIAHIQRPDLLETTSWIVKSDAVQTKLWGGYK